MRARFERGAGNRATRGAAPRPFALARFPKQRSPIAVQRPWRALRCAAAKTTSRLNSRTSKLVPIGPKRALTERSGTQNDPPDLLARKIASGSADLSD